MKVGIITSDSRERTICESLRTNSYNQFRAHGYNVLYILNKLGIDTVYDIGEKKSELGPLDDFKIHLSTFNMVGYQATSEEFFQGDELKLIIFLYYYDETDKSYAINAWNKTNFVIYYASDDEIYYRNYLLNDLMNQIIKVDLTKLIAILSGHKYSTSYPTLCSNSYHVPMIPNPQVKQMVSLNYPTFDFFLNSHHHSKVALDYASSLRNHKLLVFSNPIVGEYIRKDMVKYVNNNITLFLGEGANLSLLSLVKEVSKCKYYLLPNTYYHTDKWYRTRYVQSVMYTHKVLEAYYADRMILGDLTEENLTDLNCSRHIPFISRSIFYRQLGIDDPMEDVIKKCTETMNQVVNFLKFIL